MMLGKDQGTISRWLSLTDQGFPSFDEWSQLVGLIKDHTGSIEPLRGMCNWHGADAIALSSDGLAMDPKTLGRLTSIIARKEGMVVSLLVQILEDGQVDPEEEEELYSAYPDIESLYLAVGDLRERARAAHHARKPRTA